MWNAISVGSMMGGLELIEAAAREMDRVVEVVGAMGEREAEDNMVTVDGR
jgi:hypothetical protein